jgi:hypothetical protein
MTASLPISARNRLYFTVAGLGAAGGALLVTAHASGNEFTPCPFKLLTGIACPACGSTRAVLAMFQGQDPLPYNPLGIITFGVVAVALVAMIRDVATGSDALYRTWTRVEQWLRRPAIAAAGIALLGSNWIWTIVKGL